MSPSHREGRARITEAFDLLLRLHAWQTVEGFERISRREIHQRVRGTVRFKYARDLDAPLAELIRQEFIRRVESPRRRRRGRPPGAVYELVRPEPRHRRKSTHSGRANTAPPVTPPAPASPPRPTKTTTPPVVVPTHPDPEVAWRVAILWEREMATGKPYAGGVRDVAPRPGHCRCCGDPLSPGDDAHCRFCLVAKLLVIMAWKRRMGESRQDAQDRSQSGPRRRDVV